MCNTADFGIESSSPQVRFEVTQARKQKIVAGLVAGIGAMCKARKVTVFNGEGSLRPGRRVDVRHEDGSTTEISATHVLLAAGSVPGQFQVLTQAAPS